MVFIAQQRPFEGAQNKKRLPGENETAAQKVFPDLFAPKFTLSEKRGILAMKLQTKSIISFNACIIFACAVIALIGWFNASHGFDATLQMQATSNLRIMLDSIDSRYPGEWHVTDGVLYKGRHNMNEDTEIVDVFGITCRGFVTFFAGDTRISTNVKDEKGVRNTGTKAADHIVETVLKHGKPYNGRATVLGNEYMSAYVPLKDNNGQSVGMAFLGVDMRTMDDVRRSFMIYSVIAVLVLSGVLSFASYVIIGRTIRPLIILTNALSQIAKGDLRSEDLPVNRRDELGTLSHSANGMKSRLKDVLQNVASSAETVAASSQELTTNANQTTESVTQVAENATNMAAGAAMSADTVSQLTEQAQTMGETIDLLQKNAGSMQTLAQKSQDVTADGQAKVRHAIREINAIAEQVQASAAIVDTLGKRSDEIGSIVETISGIAEQTNLLALNAAIEAARAGEAGRGFAVVAEEVRKLAEQSGIAAQDIAERIIAIQQDTTKAVESIQAGNDNVHKGTEAVTASGAAFDAIAAQFDELVQTIRTAFDGVQAVSRTSREMIAAMGKVQEISNQSQEDTQTISAATEEQAAAMQEMANASQTLAKLAQTLQGEVQKFRL